MSKQQRSVTQVNISTPHAAGQQIEHKEVLDDNLLPEAGEIERLAKIDPNIMTWLKECAVKEQNFRHEEYCEKREIVARNESNNRILNVIGLIFAFLIFMAGLGISAFLVYKGNTTIGSIFAGGTLLGAAQLFITRKAKSEMVKTKDEGNKPVKRVI